LISVEQHLHISPETLSPERDRVNAMFFDFNLSPYSQAEWRQCDPGIGVASQNGGANQSAVGGAVRYLTDSKKCFGIIRAALSLLESVYDLAPAKRIP
jgi:hypothetical protein